MDRLITRCGSRTKKKISQIAPHPHGPHACYCPTCGYTMTVQENQRCNKLVCPSCGNDVMRATETGERRVSGEITQGMDTLFVGLLTGIGLALGFLVVKKLETKFH